MKHIKYLSLIALALYSQSAFTMESNEQEARSKSPTFMEEIKTQLPANLDARIADAQAPKGMVSRFHQNQKVSIFNEVADSMQLLLEKLVAKPSENALAQAAQINEAVKDVAMRLWGKQVYQIQSAYQAWQTIYKRALVRISRGESLEERLKRPIFKAESNTPASVKDAELQKLMRTQDRRCREANILHEEVRDLLNEVAGTSLTPAERLKIQDIERKERELKAMRAGQENQTTEQLLASAQAAQAETQALRNEVQSLLQAHKSEAEPYGQEFDTATSMARSRLETFSNQNNLSEDDAEEVMRILDGTEYTAEKLFGDKYKYNETYKKWLSDTRKIRAKARNVLYHDIPALE